MNEFEEPETTKPQTPEPRQPAQTEEEQRQRKREKHRKKNEKYKAKKHDRPSFKHEIIRPIYYRYDYRTIRAQLQADDVHHTHQIRINDARTEVTINFKSEEEREDERKKVPISYFTDVQYHKRWHK